MIHCQQLHCLLTELYHRVIVLAIITMISQRVTIEVQDILPPVKAAEHLGVTTMTLWRWVRDGKITPVMLDHAYFHLNELNRVKEMIVELSPKRRILKEKR